MGTDRRLGRGERSGRYGSEGREEDLEWSDKESTEMERQHDRRRVDKKHKEGYDDRDQDSPERGRKRHNSDRSDDEYDKDYPDPEEESKTIMLRGLSINVTEEDIRIAMEQLQGPQPVDIRLMKKRAGISRGFAFVEFYHLQDSSRWMETNQNKLVIQGRNVAVHYSNRKKFENWLCNACGLYNFRKRVKCYRCGAGKTGESSGGNPPNLESQQSSDVSGDTIILRNIASQSTVKGILSILAPYANLFSSNIRLIKDKQTGHNRGFAFIQLSSPLEASQLLTILQGLQPPLKLDGKTVGVDYAKSSRKDSKPADGIRANALTVASTAIAAAQWSSSQLRQHSGSRASLHDDYAQQLQGGDYPTWPQQPEGQVAGIGDGLLGAAPGIKPLLPAATGVVIAQAAQSYQPVINTLTVQQQQTALQQAAGVCTTQHATSPSSTAANATGAEASANKTIPDTSTYQYDESSRYYYDPQTGLYYDPTSQYYYNGETQQYLYWDSEKQAYVPVSEDSIANAAAGSTASNKESKEKKEKPKTKSAQQIAKDMERWAKSMNKQKESLKSVFQVSGSSREEERKESAAADAAFSLFEKKTGGFEMSLLMAEQYKFLDQEIPVKNEAIALQNEENDPEEGGVEKAADEDEKITDWKKMVCMLCRRQFPTKEALLRHQQLSDLHKQNLEIYRKTRFAESEQEDLERRESELKYRDRAAERREKYGIPEPPAPKKKKNYQPPKPVINFEQPTKDGLTSDNIGNKMLQAMGWQEGKGLGRHQQGITTPISASLRTKGTGLGIKGSAYELSPSGTYKDAVRKAMFARFTEIE